MTARERAKALGWVDDGLNWYDADEIWRCGSWRDRWRAPKFARPDIVDAWLALNGLREWLYFDAEDEALEHALLLRDVWLS